MAGSAAHDSLPDGPLPDHFAPPPSRGFFDGQWFTEEVPEAGRLGIRVEKLLHEETSAFQKIAVYDTTFFGRLLTLDNIVMLTERDEFVYHEMLTHVPLCSIPDPSSVLIIGGGDCGCIREVLKHPSVTSVVLCEIDERVTRVCEKYYPWLQETLADSRVELVFADGVSYVASNEAAFDLVVVDSTDPVGAAAGLFLSDFYKKVARALKPGGVMTAQTESPFWDNQLLRSIYSQIRQVFTGAVPYLGGVPTYPSGNWSWAYASLDRGPHDYLDRTRSEAVSAQCRYYNAELQQAAFALPNFVQRLLEGQDLFADLDRRRRQSGE
ncbi:MAG: polyamine aminopropyltransferase [Planctomycetota bacterium]